MKYFFLRISEGIVPTKYQFVSLLNNGLYHIMDWPQTALDIMDWPQTALDIMDWPQTALDIMDWPQTALDIMELRLDY